MGIELANPFRLPDVQFIGGDVQRLEFNAVHQNGGEVSLIGSTAFFSVIHYSDRFNADAVPVISKEMGIGQGSNGMENILTVKLTAMETVNLHGQYVYQITLITKEGDPEVHQGIMRISRNVDRDLIK